MEAAISVLPVCVQGGMLQIPLCCHGDANCRHKLHMLSSQPAPLAALQDIAGLEASQAALHGAVTLEGGDSMVCRLPCVILHQQCTWRRKLATSQLAASAVPGHLQGARQIYALLDHVRTPAFQYCEGSARVSLRHKTNHARTTGVADQHW